MDLEVFFKNGWGVLYGRHAMTGSLKVRVVKAVSGFVVKVDPDREGDLWVATVLSFVRKRRKWSYVQFLDLLDLVRRLPPHGLEGRMTGEGLLVYSGKTNKK